MTRIEGLWSRHKDVEDLIFLGYDDRAIEEGTGMARATIQAIRKGRVMEERAQHQLPPLHVTSGVVITEITA